MVKLYKPEPKTMFLDAKFTWANDGSYTYKAKYSADPTTFFAAAKRSHPLALSAPREVFGLPDAVDAALLAKLLDRHPAPGD
ncbi:hypothetical protein LHU53_08665 [Rhodoferax sp. U2-2l]|uniref:hypothetical protein n=1 Tax=Rhodoferax sp. U2-2l TaxID=2884000 RepID=UPI001D0B2A31|nr:hypothetical protein [Rhodoferax sp. U2-2l]MCB8746977.1 hypothetical protein [Rhodoferax sp. U2-2l]